MGSLMAGWDSNVQDPKQVKFTRNKSMTKDEIESFWKIKKKKEKEHLKELSLLSPRTKKMMFEEAVENGEALSKAEKDLLEMESETSLDKNGWWISSKWAFLNEPPVITQEGSGYKYAAQFHVADVSGSCKTHGSTGISA